MILINLLPHREAARKKRQDIFNISLGASALAGGVIAGLIFLWIEGQISSQQGQNRILTAEITKLDTQIKEIAALEEEIAALRARQQAVENLQADRNLPVYLLTDAVKQLPDDVQQAAERTALIDNEERRISVRAWYAFAQLRQKLLKLYPQQEAQKLAAEAVFNTRAQDALDALVIGRSQAE